MQGLVSAHRPPYDASFSVSVTDETRGPGARNVTVLDGSWRPCGPRAAMRAIAYDFRLVLAQNKQFEEVIVHYFWLVLAQNKQFEEVIVHDFCSFWQF